MGRNWNENRNTRCKTRWSYLRDLYSKSRKNRRLNGTVRKGKPWKYETEMAFVIPFLDKSKKSNAFQGKRSSRLYGEKPAASPASKDIVSDNGKTSPTETVPNSWCTVAQSQPINPGIFVQDYSNNQPTASRDALVKYFEAIAETVRGFAPALQVKVKTEISRIVHQAEMECIQQSQSQFESLLQTGPEARYSPNNTLQYDCVLTKQEGSG
ncbi:uncharacterized protein LOC116426826 isoform X2 [Nomia melanderi]|uniref:uncharacterized protein LOC116426826 isoform X2 n=1 Tax=Nomia melanderi TaxID=2448451 RepID=UPI003FCC4AC8